MKKNVDLFSKEKYTFYKASPRLKILVDNSLKNNETHLLFLNSDLELIYFPLGSFHTTNKLKNLEFNLKHYDYHLIYESNQNTLIQELKQSKLFSERSEFYKNNRTIIKNINGLSKTLYRDDNDALLDVLAQEKKDVIKRKKIIQQQSIHP